MIKARMLKFSAKSCAFKINPVDYDAPYNWALVLQVLKALEGETKNYLGARLHSRDVKINAYV
ncbi:hypothetical protein M8C21_002476, partial [Ambrosia artemisiifolia]